MAYFMSLDVTETSDRADNRYLKWLKVNLWSWTPGIIEFFICLIYQYRLVVLFKTKLFRTLVGFRPFEFGWIFTSNAISMAGKVVYTLNFVQKLHKIFNNLQKFGISLQNGIRCLFVSDSNFFFQNVKFSNSSHNIIFYYLHNN